MFTRLHFGYASLSGDLLWAISVKVYICSPITAVTFYFLRRQLSSSHSSDSFAFTDDRIIVLVWLHYASFHAELIIINTLEIQIKK